MKLSYVTAIVTLIVVAMGLLSFGTTDVVAYDEYAAGCDNCHGGFRDSPYISLVDGQNWGNDLMDGHEVFLNNDCDACHTTGGRSPTFLGSSNGGDGLAALGCIGCHGRDEGSGVTGAGLRQHHWVAGIETCGNAGCHPDDSDPAVFTTVGEGVLPPYYENPGNDHPGMPTNPCNLASLGYPEDVLGEAGTGLDNDGDNLYDENDGECDPVTSELTTWSRIKSTY